MYWSFTTEIGYSEENLGLCVPIAVSIFAIAFVIFRLPSVCKTCQLFHVCHCRVSKLVHGTGNGKVVAQIEQILNNGGTGLSITKAMANMDTVTDIVAQI